MGHPTLAAVLFDQNVTPDIIFGSGNANGGFTVDTGAGGIEIGLRAKVRFDVPQDVYNSNGAGTYTFPNVLPTIGFPTDPGSPTTTPIWNFEWSVNTDVSGTSGLQVDDFTYEVGIDFDPSTGTNFLVFDPITAGSTIPYTVPQVVPEFDHAFGDNTTTNGGGTVATIDGIATDYIALAAGNNVVQNSGNYEFLNNFAPYLNQIDPTENGTYDIYLLARNGSGTVVARSDIQIISGVGGPDPVGASSTVGLVLILGLVMVGMAFAITRRRRLADAR